MKETNTDRASENNDMVMNRTIKDSVFTNLFSQKKNVLEMYRVLHPEDTAASEDDIEIWSLRNVLVTDIYNDLGFSVHGKRIFLVECQSTWNENMPFRMLEYLADTYSHYVTRNELDVYRQKAVDIPPAECYVIYIGEKKDVPKTLSLQDTVFHNSHSDIGLTVHIITDCDPSNIVGQYIAFSRIINGQAKEYGRTREAVKKAIDLCIKKGILTEFLTEHREEVVSMYDQIFLQENVIANHTRNARNEAMAEGKAEGKAEERESGIKKLIACLRSFDLPEATIRKQVISQYGNVDLHKYL